MCGIAGFIGSKKFLPSKKTIDSCLELMKERGPDYQSYKKDNFFNNTLLFLFSRLSIIDISKKSNLIFEDEDGILVFNGEIYNFEDLKKNYLININLKTNCDTEVLLKMLGKYWVEALSKLDGMWSFAYYSKKKGKVLLSRDNFGEKPLYYYKSNMGICFGSNTNYIKKLTKKKFTINNSKINDFLRYGFRSFGLNEDSFHLGIKELRGGNSIIINKNLKILKRKNFDISKKKSIKNSSFQKNKIKKIMIDSIKTRLNADCKVGVLLSGGVDSNLIAHTAIKKFKKKILLYSYKIPRKKNIEEKNINHSIKNFKKLHKYVKIKKFTAKELIEITKKVGSPISAPNFLLYHRIHTQAKKDKCKVVINGFGADEIFGGYFSHQIFYLISNLKNKKFLKLKNVYKKYFLDILKNPKMINIESLLGKINKISNLNFYLQDIENRQKFLKLKFPLRKYEKKYNQDYFKNKLLNDLFKFYMPSQLLDADNLAMINSVENRSPFFNLELLKETLKLKNESLVKNGYGKFVIRELFKNIIPKKILLDRNKVGFNCDIRDLIKLDSNGFKKLIFSTKLSKKIINTVEIVNLLNKEKINNSENHFLFSLISTNAFIIANKY